MKKTRIRHRALCESCGAVADVRLEDGSTWCDACDEAAETLGYDDEVTV